MVCNSWVSALQMGLLEASLHKIGQPKPSCWTASINNLRAYHAANNQACLPISVLCDMFSETMKTYIAAIFASHIPGQNR
jgi:hypothetical protein